MDLSMDPEIGGHVEPIYRIGFAFPLKVNQFDFKQRLMKKDAEINVEFEDGSIRITGTTSKLKSRITLVDEGQKRFSSVRTKLPTPN